MKPTKETFSLLQDAYDCFNKELFNSELPPCLILIHRKRGAHGYFWSEQFYNKDGKKLDEIALNPETMNREIKIVLSTLVHEMVHLWQYHYGKPSRNGYHNKQWANKMEEVGLMPSTTGKEGGKRTGQRVTHYIAENEPFDLSFASWSTTVNQSIEWFGKPNLGKATQTSKQKFTCPNCEQNAWAKPAARLVCGDCEVEMLSNG